MTRAADKGGTAVQDIFLNYRREDARGFARALYEDLSEQFGAGVVFRDVDAIDPGVDFVRAIRSTVANCKVFLVLIGRNWLNAKNDDGTRRLDDPRDYVRLEVEAALKQKKVSVIPVLVEGAAMPGQADLPPSLKDLSSRNAIRLDDDRWHADVARLATTIAAFVPRIPSPAAAPAVDPAGEPTVVLEDRTRVSTPPAPAVQRDRQRAQRRLVLAVGVSLAALLVIGLLVVISGDERTQTEAVASRSTTTLGQPVTTVSSALDPAPTSTLVAPGPASGPIGPGGGPSAGPASGSGAAPGAGPSSGPAPTSPPPTPPATRATTTTTPPPKPGINMLVISPSSGRPGTVIRLSAGACARPAGWTGGEIYFGLSNASGDDPVKGQRWWAGGPWEDQLVVPSLAPGTYWVWANCYASDTRTNTWTKFHDYPSLEFTVTG